jgi:hypothetical protein
MRRSGSPCRGFEPRAARLPLPSGMGLGSKTPATHYSALALAETTAPAREVSIFL